MAFSTLTKAHDSWVLRISILFNGSIIVVSCVCLCGWLTGNILLASWSKTYIPMARPTALLFLLFSTLLLTRSLWPSWKPVGALMLLVTLASIAYCTHVLLLNGSIQSIAELVAHHPRLFNSAAHVGHVSPLTAIGFIGAGLVLLLMVCPRCPAPVRVASEALTFGIFFLGFVGTVGYSYGTPLLHGGPHTPIALPTSILFMVLAVALISPFGRKTILARLFLGSSIQARLNRTFLPAIAILMLVQGFVRIKILLHFSNSSQFFSNLNLSVAAAVGTIAFLSVTALIIMFLGRWVGRDLELAQGALRESELLYRSLFDNMLNGFAYCRMLFDHGLPTDFVYLKVNNAFETLTGLKNVTGKKVSEIIPGIRESDGDLLKIYGRVALSGTSERFEVYLKALKIWFSISVYSPEREYFVAVFDVITERKMAEQRLQESERHLRRSQEAARIGNWSWDLKTNKLTCSDETYRIFGIEKSTFDGDLNTIINSSIHPEDRAAVEQRRMGALRENHLQPTEYRVVWPDGSLRHVWAETQDRDLDHQGNIVRLSGVFQDITDRKAAELALASEKERLMVTLRSMGDGFIATDVQGNVILMNKVAEDLTGWPQSEARGKPLGTVFDAADERSMTPLDPTQRVLASGEIVSSPNHTLLGSRDGMEYITLSSWAPIRDSKGKTIGVVLVFRDITEKEKLLQRLHRSEKLDSIGVLAGGIAHDFNNLLGGIFGYMELAKKGIASGAAAAKHLDAALGVFDRAKDLTHQMLTFSKGGSPLRKVGALAPVIERNVSFALSGSTVACRYHLENLWLCDFDENQMGQVFNNIAINAIEAMPMGGTIDIFGANVQIGDGERHPLKAGRYVRISVVDTGVGIPRELHERIFDPFFTTKQKGNGLGLSICYSIMQKHQGCIEVESAPGKGTAFQLFIPASDAESIEGLPVRIPTHKGSGVVLIMDDEDYIREVVGELFRKMGYNTRDAENGEQALKILANMQEEGQAARFALLDLTIPGGAGGKQIIGEIRQKYSRMPVFAASGYSQDPIMAKPTAFGFTDSIRKPFNELNLAEMLNRHLT